MVLALSVGGSLAWAQPGVDWVGMTMGQFDTPETAQYAHVTLIRTAASRLGGTWGAYTLVGAIEDSHIDFTLTDVNGAEVGFLRGTIGQDMFSGIGTIIPARRPGSTAAQPQVEVKWTLTRGKVPPSAPKVHTYEPVSYYGVYSAKEPPVLHIFPGDTVNTRTMDAARDAGLPRHGNGGDVNVGPFYVEGALPGDTLVVKLLKVKPNKVVGRQGSRFNQYAVTQEYQLAAKYDPSFNGSWNQDVAKGTATLPATSGLPHLTIPLKPMLGCISVAPAGNDQYRGTDLGPYGGNLDYNDNVAGTTLYFPVFHPGALLGMGDAHGAMGDGEVVGTGLETSVDVTFTVDVIKGYQTPQVRAETSDYIISFGVSGSVPESIQLATTQLAEWVKKDYKLNDSEVALLFGDVLKYDIAELVDPHFNVAAKLPKKILATLNQ
jgi:acetamidase/formamidase